MYFTLTGETLFESQTRCSRTCWRFRDAKQRILFDGQALVPELRQRPDACRAVDAAIGRATSARSQTPRGEKRSDFAAKRQCLADRERPLRAQARPPLDQ